MVWRVDPDAGAGPGLAYFPVGTCGGCTATGSGGGAGIGTFTEKLLKPSIPALSPSRAALPVNWPLPQSISSFLGPL